MTLGHHQQHLQYDLAGLTLAGRVNFQVNVMKSLEVEFNSAIKTSLEGLEMVQTDSLNEGKEAVWTSCTE